MVGMTVDELLKARLAYYQMSQCKDGYEHRYWFFLKVYGNFS